MIMVSVLQEDGHVYLRQVTKHSDTDYADKVVTVEESEWKKYQDAEDMYYGLMTRIENKGEISQTEIEHRLEDK